MSSNLWPFAAAVARRNVRAAVRDPALWVPPLAFPVFSLVALAGGLSRLEQLPGFGYPGGYTAFQFAFSVIQVACFGGVFLGLAVAGDFESGFMRRLMLASGRREAILLGYTMAALARFAITVAIVFAIAVAGGMRVLGDVGDLATLLAVGLLVTAASFLFAAGVAMRMRSLDAGGIMLMPIFTLLFLAPVYVPAGLLSGWLAAAASVNPVTAFLEGGRSLLAGGSGGVAGAVALAVAAALLLLAYAVRGLRRAQVAGS
jgi:ABC-type multidrug transport system permease subunit